MSRIGGRMVLAAAVACLAAMPMLAHAHGGGMSKDGCHNHKAEDNRHWHIEGSYDIGGLCGAKGDGPLPQTIELDAGEYDALVEERDGLAATIITLRSQLAHETERLDRAENRADRAQRAIVEATAEGRALEKRYKALMSEAEFDRRTAGQLHKEAKAVLAEAEARERGAGPKASRDCRNAVGKMLAASRWNLGGAREGLRIACLE